MRGSVLAAALVALLSGGVSSGQPDSKTPLPAPARDSPAAERTRTKVLKLKVSGNFKDVTLRDVLKEFAAQVEMQSERPVMWTYADDVRAGDRVSFACKDKPLEEALDELFTAHKLGYIVISDDDGPRDGWVRITPGSERGFAVGAGPAAPDPNEEKAAATLAIARELIDKGKGADARVVLMLVANKYPKTKAAAEAKELLEKLKP